MNYPKIGYVEKVGAWMREAPIGSYEIKKLTADPEKFIYVVKQAIAVGFDWKISEDQATIEKITNEINLTIPLNQE